MKVRYYSLAFCVHFILSNCTVKIQMCHYASDRKVHSFSLKMQHKSFGGWAPFGPAGELTALSRPLAGFWEWEERKREGREGGVGKGEKEAREKEKGKEEKGKKGGKKERGKGRKGKGGEGREERGRKDKGRGSRSPQRDF